MKKRLKKLASFLLGFAMVVGNTPLSAFAASNLNPPLPSNFKNVKFVDDTEIFPLVRTFAKQHPNRSEVVSYDKSKFDVVKYDKLGDAIAPGLSEYQKTLNWYKDNYSGSVDKPSWFVSLNKAETDKIQRNGNSYIVKGDNLMTIKMYNSDSYKVNGREVYLHAKLKEVVVQPNGANDSALYPTSKGYVRNDGLKIFRVDAEQLVFENFYYFKNASHRFSSNNGTTVEDYYSKKGAVFEFEPRYVDTDEKVDDIHLSSYFGDIDTRYYQNDAGSSDERMANLVYGGAICEGFRLDSNADVMMSNAANYIIRDKFIMPSVKMTNTAASDGVNYYVRGHEGENLTIGSLHSYELGCILVPYIPETDEFQVRPRKYADKKSLNKGQDIKYTITQTIPSKLQRENKDLESVVIKDVLQAELQFKNLKLYLDDVEVDSSKYTLDTSGNIVTIAFKPEALPELYTKTVKAEITCTAKEHVSVKNIASISIDGVEKTTDEVDVPAAKPVINVTKAVNKTKAIKGDELEYTIEVRNTNNDFTQEFDATLTETPNENIELNAEPYDLHGAAGISQSGNTYTLTGIKADETATFKLKAKAVKVGNAVNSISVPNTPPVTANTIVEAPQPSITKTNNAGADIQKGDVVEFTVNAILPAIEGVTSDLAKNFTVVDTMPEGLELLDVQAPDGFELNKTASGFTAKKATVDKNGISATFKYTAKITTDKLEQLTNIATLSGSTFDNLTSNSSVNPVAPHLIITRDINKPYLTNGEQFTYTYVVTNDGSGTAKSTTLTDTIPSYLERVDGVENSGRVDFELGDIPVGQSKTVSIQFRLKKDTPKVKSVDANASTTCINGNTATADISTPTEYPVFELKKTADGEKYQIGDIATFKIAVKQTNTKVAKAYNVAVKDVLPDGLEFVEMTSEHGKVDDTIVNYEEFTQDDTITVKAKVVANGELTNVATLTVPNEPEITSDVTIKSLEPKFTVEKAVDKAEASIGDRLEYTITITNTGEVPIRGAEIIDNLDNQLVATGAAISTGDVEFDDAFAKGKFDLAVGEQATFTVHAKIVASHEIAYRDVVVNNAIVTVGKIPPVTSNTVETKLNRPTAEIQKLVDKTKLTEDEYATYTLRVIPKNGTPLAVKIHDTLPEHMELDASSIKSNIGEATIIDRDIRFFVEKLEEPAEITYRAKAIKNGEHTNTLQVNIPGIPPLVTTAQTTKVATNLDIAKEADVAKTYVNEDVNYTVKVTKDAPIAKNVIVEDVLPSELKLNEQSVKVETFDKNEVEVKDNKIVVKLDKMTQDFEIKYTAKAIKPGDIENIASVDTPDTDKKQSEAKVEVIAPEAQLTKIITNEGKFKALGDYIEYKVHVTTKDKYVDNLELTDILPKGVELDKNSISLDTDDKYEVEVKGNKYVIKMQKMTKDFTISYRAKIVEYGTYKNVVSLNVPNKPTVTAEATTKLDRPKPIAPPQTGDTSNIRVFAMLAGLAAFGFLIFAYKKERE